MTTKTKRTPRIPKLSLHKATGQWRAVFNGRSVYFGKDEQAARLAHAVHAGKWVENGCQPLPSDEARPAPIPQAHRAGTIANALDAYLRHIEELNTDPTTGQLRPDGRYRKKGKWTTEWLNLRQAFTGLPRKDGARPGGFATHFGQRPVDELGEDLLLEWREMLERQTSPVLTRIGINRKVRLVLGALKWCKSRKLIAKEQWDDCRDLEPLRKGEAGNGRPGKRPKREVPADDIETVAEQLEAPVTVNGTDMPGNRQVAAMLRVQHLLGCRPGELCEMRWEDIDLEGTVDPKGRAWWIYTVASAKTDHREDHAPTVYPISPRAQKILAKFQRDGAAGYVFSPRTSMAERGRARGSDCSLQDCWSTRSYGNAVLRAVKKAGVRRFTPHELRHTRITNTFKLHGHAAAQRLGNHSNPQTTARYIHNDDVQLLIDALASEE